MEKKADPIPMRYNALMPYLMVDNVRGLIKFTKNVFKAELLRKVEKNDGTVLHAEIKIGDSIIMMGTPMDDWGLMPASIFLYVDNCEDVYENALENGAISIMEVATIPHAGERYGGVKDMSGNIWWIATQIEKSGSENAPLYN